MRTLAASVFVYLCCGAMCFAHNYFKARTIVGDDKLQATLRPLALACAIVMWLPYMIAMQFHNPLREEAMRLAQNMIRGPSIEPSMPMPISCSHDDGSILIECKDGLELTWCDSCGALGGKLKDGLVHWRYPQQAVFDSKIQRLDDTLEEAAKKYPQNVVQR
jgi:hypothetical protein